MALGFVLYGTMVRANVVCIYVQLTMIQKHKPVGAVIVYGGADAGHVELRTASGFVSDFISPTPYPRPLIGIYVKEI